MLKKIIICAFLILSFSVVYASDHKDMSACLPDNIGEYKSSKDALATDLKNNVLSVSRQYQYKDKTAEVFVWKIPGNKQIWPYIGGKSKANILIVSGRMCILNVDESTGNSTLVINLDKSFVTPPPYLYRVSVTTSSKNGSSVVQKIGENLDYDKLFSLYEK